MGKGIPTRRVCNHYMVFVPVQAESQVKKSLGMMAMDGVREISELAALIQ